jgi:acetylornithine deacetylase/succinyl-diaminopimelate desuccinylase-like protein
MRLAVFLAVALVFSGSTQAALPEGFDEASIRRAAAGVFPDYFDLLSMPSDSIKPEDIQRNAAWLVKAFEKRGFKARELDNKGKPLVFAAYEGNRGKRPTILFYIHFDAQPVVPSQWSQKDPWVPVVKRRGSDGKWTEIDKSELFRPDFDPELRVFARASADDKGPIAMFLASFDLLRERGVLPAIDVKVLLDAAEHASGRPTILFGNRGVQPLTLTVYGPKVPLHSGHYGNYAPNPAQRLARLLAGMKDDDGRVTIPGYYDKTKFTDTDRKAMSDVPDDEETLKKRLGIAEPDKVGANYQEALQYPTLNIRGMAAGGVGDKVATIIPSQAVAELDLRTTVEADGPYLAGLVKSYVESQGYFLVDHEPTDEDRAAHAKLAQLKIGKSDEGARQDMDSAVGRWAVKALQDSSDQSPVRLRQMGGTVPTADIVGPMKLPFLLVPTVNADDNQHTYDENLRMGQFLTGMRSMLGLLLTAY